MGNYAEPWRAWVNFEFIDDAGRVNEVDALVLLPCGLFLIEIKSRPGDVTGDAATWTWNTEGRLHTRDNPLLLANRKAKRLAGLLKQQQSIIKSSPSTLHSGDYFSLCATCEITVTGNSHAPCLSTRPARSV